MKLLLIEVGLLDKNGQYAEIKVTKSAKTEQIKDDAANQEEEIPLRTLTSITTLSALVNLFISLSLKSDNQESIALAHNLVLHIQTKHIDIQHYYIYDIVTEGRINLQYILTSEIIVNRLIKILT